MNLETIVSAAVQQAISPLIERIAALESAVDKANLAEFIEGEIIATLQFTDIVGEDRVAKIESRIEELSAAVQG